VSSRNALAFIFVTILIDMIGFGIIIPVMPALIVELTGVGLGQAAIWGGRLLVVYAAMQFVFAPIIGNLSDRFGRRPVLLASLVAFGADYVIMGFAPTLAWLFLGRALAGIAGASHTTASAFIADVSAPEERAKNFGLVGAAFGLGFIIGPVIGGLLGEYGARIPFYAAGGLAFANAIYGYLVLPETLPPEKRRPFAWQRANPVGAFGEMRRYPLVIALFAVLFFYQIAHDANPSTWSYYTMLKFDWSPRDVGYSLGAIGVLFALVQGVLIRVVIPRIGEARTVAVGFVAMAVGFVGFAFATRGWMLYAFLVPFSLAGLANPALRGLLSNRVPSNAQGELQGAIASLVSVTAIIAPWLMTELFGAFTSAAAPIYFPGAPFVAAALLMGVALAWFGWTARAGALAASPGPTLGSAG
jgi:DHA1 family tetracycline resistance protein-like MFS transporter